MLNIADGDEYGTVLVGIGYVICVVEFLDSRRSLAAACAHDQIYWDGGMIAMI